MPDKALVSPLACCRVSTYRWMNPGRFDPLAPPPHHNTEKTPVIGSDSERR